MDPKEFTKIIVELILQKKGSNIRILDIKKVSYIADYFIICSADSDMQVKAIAESVEDGLRDRGIKVMHKEGYSALNWVLLDYFDVVVHVFRHESRSFYNLEKLWGDAPYEIVEESVVPPIV
ncbi:MAG: ribosome silencing factor [Ignavibacteriales bacterium]|nr:ribosome silencing factor [Ignavibacteriales bacterium]MCF8307147.1 ribosome silencing factor [Ignavibacteriales bacterium]MCF8316805.1 ribosome silencing factor [Ignavibacteriales bacterium]MCF8438381.1 ribosome silencing factor [Ignavibacteriales bacterium]